jgi:hypothetical protein
MKVLLDGSKMPAKVFYKKFREIVGVSFGWWIRRKNVKQDGGNEWYDYTDDKFTLGGSAYDPPKLYGKSPERKVA